MAIGSEVSGGDTLVGRHRRLHSKERCPRRRQRMQWVASQQTTLRCPHARQLKHRPREAFEISDFCLRWAFCSRRLHLFVTMRQPS